MQGTCSNRQKTEAGRLLPRLSPTPRGNHLHKALDWPRGTPPKTGPDVDVAPAIPRADMRGAAANFHSIMIFIGFQSPLASFLCFREPLCDRSGREIRASPASSVHLFCSRGCKLAKAVARASAVVQRYAILCDARDRLDGSKTTGHLAKHLRSTALRQVCCVAEKTG